MPDLLPAPRLHPDLTLHHVELTVGSLGRSLDFYREVLGLTVLAAGDGAARLGVGGRTLLALRELPGAAPAPRSSPGLYHFALLVPTRADLGRFVRHAGGLGVRLGQSDHLVSEAFYLQDPDGHGIEVYRDRPRGEWRWVGGEVRMAGDPIDLPGLLLEAGPPAPWTGLPDGTVMGHVHLRVADLGAAEAFYAGTLGFDVVSRWPGALFVSVGGYHHHLGLNTWQSLGGEAAPGGSAHLERVWLHLPDAEALDALAGRLRLRRVSFTEPSHAGGTLEVRDPFGTRLAFTA
ncbi:ring-cleavage extradiol dioxygenase (plasmid) [Deinococcus aetherius]|uniref:Ring-cleavage extradiol dioxygenase n=1 Tax=Deinococcus aetherius TaxID=200252 RepID=A0ABM8AHX9_9DEIO|nr:VOC family protein [Deinococcus aetherius]BDP43419.1 ring-cleavage extradiol dioxygenase [Deinococcus aetherius]